jgi:hypothetical protein
MPLEYRGPAGVAKQAPRSLDTKTGALEPGTYAALINAGATILSTIFGIWAQPDQPKVDKEEDTSLKFQGKETMPFQSTLRDPGPAPGMMADTSTNVGVGGAPRATAMKRIRANYQLPTMLS